MWFYVLFLAYPGCSVSTFMFFNAEDFNAEGEDGLSVMRVDRSVDRSSSGFQTFAMYAVIMFIICESHHPPLPPAASLLTRVMWVM